MRKRPKGRASLAKRANSLPSRPPREGYGLPELAPAFRAGRPPPYSRPQPRFTSATPVLAPASWSAALAVPLFQPHVSHRVIGDTVNRWWRITLINVLLLYAHSVTSRHRLDSTNHRQQMLETGAALPCVRVSCPQGLLYN